MRLPQIFKACLVLGAFIGCDSEVTPADGGGGSGSGGVPSTGGNGGEPILSGGGGDGGMGGAIVISGGAGGMPPGNACEQVCANVENCFGVTCAAAGIDCNDPTFDCPAECLVDASCADLLAMFQNQQPSPRIQACLEGCQGQGGGGGGSNQSCGQCMFGQGCVEPCQNDPNCQAWGQCAIGCTDPACYADCNAMHPEAQAAFMQVYACGCTSCDSACEMEMDPCTQPGGGG